MTATWAAPNRMRSVSRASAVAVLAALACATPAQAADVTRVRLGSSITDLVTGPDGGAWVQITRDRGDEAIGRATPDGRFSTARVEQYPEAAALGPDGQAWFKLDAREFVRSDGVGRQTSVRLPGSRPFLGQPMATGADGTLWALTVPDHRFAHITPAGGVSYTPTGIPDCGKTDFLAAGSPIFTSMERASDGAMWLVDAGCSRLVRVAATQTTQFKLELPDPMGAAADAAGGMWFAGERPGHVDAAGRVRRFDLDTGGATDVAVASDGGAWFATGSCTLARVTPDGELTTAPTPIPARQIAFDPAGGMWLASATRLVHVAPGEAFGTCDDSAPEARVNRGRDRIGLRELRRGVRVAVREPALVTPILFFSDDEDDTDFGTAVPRSIVVDEPRGGALRVRIAPARVRRFARMLAAGRQPVLGVALRLDDREGNSTLQQFALRVRR